MEMNNIRTVCTYVLYILYVCMYQYMYILHRQHIVMGLKFAIVLSVQQLHCERLCLMHMHAYIACTISTYCTYYVCTVGSVVHHRS